MEPFRINLWFDGQAEEAANFYVSTFPDSKLLDVARYPTVGQEVHGGEAGSVMTVTFELNGQPFLALNGGPTFTFNEAVSLEVRCKDQAELDHYWDVLREGGDPDAQQCGWLKDRFGLSWQVVPENWEELLGGPDEEASTRAFAAMLQMKKLDIAALRAAYEGTA